MIAMIYCYMGPALTVAASGNKFKSTFLGTSATGEFGNDTVRAGGAEVKSFTFGKLDDNVLSDGGIFGIAPGGRTTFSKRLKDQGSIHADSYSLYMDNEKTGGILFGGVDTKKYTGPLYQIPVSSNSYWTPKMSLSLDGKPVDSFPGAVFDCGAEYLFVPVKMYKAFVSAAGFKWNAKDKGYVLFEKPTSEVTVDFSGAKIRLPLRDFLYEIKETVKGKTTYRYKLSGIVARGTHTPLVGLSLQRRMLLAYHHDRHELAIAQGSGNSKESHVVPIGPDGIPGAIKAPEFDDYKGGK